MAAHFLEGRRVGIIRIAVFIDAGDHAGQFAAGSIGERHHRARLHGFLEGIAGEPLHVLRIVLAKGVLGRDLERPFVTGSHALEWRLEARRQIAVTELERGRLLAASRVDRFAVLELHREMQRDFHAVVDAVVVIVLMAVLAHESPRVEED
mgnify:CR=1 FL=1